MSQLSDQYKEDQNNKVSSNMRAHAIATVRYKVYIFILIVILVFIWPMVEEKADTLRGTWSLDDLLKISELPNIYANFIQTRGEEGWILNQIDEVDEQIAEVEKNTENAKLTLEIIESLNEPWKQNTIINCLNNWMCDEIEEKLIPFLPLFRTYMLVGNLKWEKMSFNQKVILKNINDFLLKTSAWLENGEIQEIGFSSPIQVDKNLELYKIPITLRVKFEHKKMLISFLHNIEEKISFTIPILYKVTALTYNIVNYAEEQSVNISLDAYYIKTLWEENVEES